MLKGCGLQKFDQWRNNLGTGNYIIEVYYQLPDKLSEDEKLALQDIKEYHEKK